MKLLNNLKIGKRLYLVFGLILTITLLNLIYNIVNLGTSKQSVIEINTSLLSIDHLIEADRDAYQSNIAISQALLPENFNDKDKLANLIKEVEENKNQINERYNKFAKLFNVNEIVETTEINEIFTTNFNQLSLVTDSIAYYLKAGNDSSAYTLYYTKYNNYFSTMRASLNDFTELHLMQSEKSYNKNLELNSSIKRNSIIIFIVIFILFFVSGYGIVKSILDPLSELKLVITELSQGKLPEVKTTGNDEISQMGISLSVLKDGLNKTAFFAQEIGKGNLQTEFIPLSAEDVLGHSLIQMKTNLAKFAIEDEQRNWINNGIANLGDILRDTNLNSETLYQNTLTYIVKYIRANQGGLFVINNENTHDSFIELVASYAYERKKFIQARIEMGEGLVGQAILEKDIIYMTEVPESYVRITSGTGEALPRNILIVPLKNNDEVFGVIELASFHILHEYEIEFMKKISESLASAISSVKINEKTQHLLEQSQQMTEELRAQEEEMRQNMEELHATQEEMTRTSASLQQEVKNLKIENEKLRMQNN